MYRTTQLYFSFFWLLVVTLSLTACDSIDTNKQPIVNRDVTLSAPQGLAAEAGDGEIQLSWKALSGATTYTLYWSTRDDVSKDSGTAIHVADTSIIHTELSNGVPYYYIVSATTDFGEGNSSEVPVTATPQYTQPDVANNIGAMPGDNRNTITWDSVIGATSYSIFWSTQADKTVSATDKRIDFVNSPFVHNQLDNNVEYHYSVVALNNDRHSQLSQVVSATPTTPPPMAPVNVNAVFADASITIEWQDISNASQFDIYWNNSGNVSTADQRLGPVSSPFKHALLKPDATYHYIIVASNEGGAGQPTSSFSVDTKTGDIVLPPTGVAPDVPTFSSIAINDQQITLDWENQDPDTKAYNIYWQTGAANVSIDSNKIANVSPPYTHIGLTNGIEVFYTITAINDSGESATASIISSTPQKLIPGVPANVVALANNKAVSLGWNKVRNAESYNIYWQEAGGDSQEVTVNNVNSPYTIASLINGKSYEFTVSANNTSGESERSTPVSATPHTPPPSAPVNLAINPGNGEIHLSWDAPRSANVDGYRLYWSTKSDINTYSAQAIDVTTQQTSYLHKNRVNGQTYYYMVAAFNAGGEGPVSKIVGAIPNPLLPGAPDGIAITPGDSQATISWLTEDNDAKYNLYHWPTTGNNIDIDTRNLTLTEKTVYTNVSPPYLLNNLVNGKTYHVYISRINANRESVFSNEVIITPQLPPPATTKLLNVVAGDSQVNLEWDAVANAQAYKLYWSTSSNVNTKGSPFISVNANDNTPNYTHTGLTNGLTFYYAIAALNSGGESAVSETTSATPQISVPVPPSAVDVFSGDGEVTIAWEAVEEAQSYNLYWTDNPDNPFNTWSKRSGFEPNNTLVGLQNGQSYTLALTAVNSGGESSPSQQLLGTPQIPAPAAPTGIAATASNTQVTVSWDELSPLKYNLYWSQQPGIQPNGAGVNKISDANTQFPHQQLSNSATYYYAVSAQNAGGESALSAEAFATPETIPTDTPLGLFAVGRNGSVNLSWQNINDSAATYTIYWDTVPISSLSTANAINNVNSPFEHKPVTNGTRYYYVISATSASESPPSPQVSAIPQVDPVGPPRGVTAMGSNNKITLNWVANSDDTVKYNIYWSDQPGKLTQTGTRISDVALPPYEDTSVSNGIARYYVVTAVNAAGESAASALVSANPGLTNNSAPVISEGDNVEIVLSEDNSPIAFALTLNASDTDNDILNWYISSNSGNGNASVGESGNSTVVQYNPTNNYNGTDNFIIQVNDNNGGIDSISVNLIIQAQNDAPELISPLTPQVADQNIPFTYTVAANSFNDVDNDVLSYNALLNEGAPLPAWLSFNAETLVFSGEPANSDVGVLEIAVTASDPDQLNATGVFTLTVKNINDAPVVINPIVKQTINEDADYLLDISDVFIDPDGDPMTFTTTAPAWLVFNDQTLSFSATPDNTNVGTITVSIVATDINLASDSTAFDLEVVNVNDAPIATDDTRNTNENSGPIIINVLANDYDIDMNDSISIQSINAVEILGSVSINATNDALVYTPPQVGTNLSDIFTYTIRDQSAAIATASVTVNITNEIAPPTANPNTYTLVEDSTDNQLMVLDNDTDPDIGDQLSITAVGIPNNNGTANIVENIIIYSPAADFFGTESFDYTISDGTFFSKSTVTITIPNTNDVPVIQSQQSLSFAEDSNFTVLLTHLIVADVDNDYPQQFTLTAYDGLNYTRSGNTIIPSADYFGMLTVPVSVNDGNDSSANFDLNINVTSVNDAPTVIDGGITAQTTDEDVPYSLNIGSVFSDPENAPLNYTFTKPNWLAFNSETLVLSGTPLNTDTGVSTVTIVATDPELASATTSFSLTVNNVNDPPEIAEGSTLPIDLDEDTTFGFSLNASDIENDPLLWTVSTPPKNGTAGVSKNIGSPVDVTYQPNSDYFGSDSFDIQVSDGNGGTDTITINVNVLPINDKPLLNTTPILDATISTTYTYNLSATDVDNPGTELVYTIGGESSPWLSLTDNFNGSATLAGTPGVIDLGKHSISIQVTDPGGAVDSQTFIITVVEGATSAAQSGATFNPVAAIAGNTEDITIQARDSAGNSKLSGGDLFTVSVSGANSVTEFIATDNADGTYSASYVPTIAGNDIVNIYLNSTQAVGASPYNLKVNAGPTSPPDSVAVLMPSTGVTTQTINMVIQARDRFGNDRTEAETGISAGIDVVGDSITPTINDNLNGTYSISYIPTQAGSHIVYLTLAGTNIFQSPFTIDVSVYDPPIKGLFSKDLALQKCVDTYAQSFEPPALLASEISGTLDCSNMGIADLSGMEYLVNLNGLILDNNPIISIDPLAALTQLSALSMQSLAGLNNISAVSQLNKLIKLYMDNTPIKDLAPLENLPAIEALRLNNTGITSVNLLAGLTSLTSLNIDGNKISDIKPLQALTLLRTLFTGNNPLVDISVLVAPNAFPVLNFLDMQNATLNDEKIAILNQGNFSALRTLHIENNQECLILNCLDITNLNFLSSMAGLSNLHADNNKIIDIVGLASLPALTRLTLSQNLLDNSSFKVFSAGISFPDLIELDFSFNNISNLIGLEGLPSLITVNLSNNLLSDNSLSPFAEGVFTFPALQNLDMSFNQITNVSIFANFGEIVGAPNMANIMNFNFASNRIGYFGGVDTLTSLLPGSKVNVSDNPNMNCSELEALIIALGAANVLPSAPIVGQNCQVPAIL